MYELRHYITLEGKTYLPAGLMGCETGRLKLGLPLD